MLQFSTRQKQAIENGGAKRLHLKQKAFEAATGDLNAAYPHTYIYSIPGLGKTYEVTKILRDQKVDHYVISGNISMFAFGVNLAVLAYKNRSKKRFVVVVDDCDEIFKNAENINIMKNILGGLKEFAYSKSMQAFYPNLSDIQKEAIDCYADEATIGFKVPTKNMIFVFTSNIKLPNAAELKKVQSLNTPKAKNIRHLHAIKDRCKPADFDLTPDEHWGWIAHGVLNDNVIKVSKEKKFIILEWMHTNWDKLSESSMRTVQKMADTMKQFPDFYKDQWIMDFLINSK